MTTLGMAGPGPQNALTLADFARLAKASLDPAVWDFVEGGAGEERTLTANLEAFADVWLRPRVLSGVVGVDLTVRILGHTWAAPIGIAPLAYHTLAHLDGEIATVQASGRAGLPVVVGTFAGRTFEDLAAAASGPLWLQVYCFRDRSVTRELVERAVRSGFQALVLTVDTPHLGRRLRDVRNGFQLPDGVVPANLPAGEYGSPSAHARAEFDPQLDWSSVSWLRSISPLPVLVKGILTADDGQRALDAGADGIVVSNHGGRQLDGAPATLAVLPQIAESVAGACPVLLDGGVRRGADVLAGLALGADAVLLGRPVLHGLAVDGRRGVQQVLKIVSDELSDAMALAGVRSVAEVDAALVISKDPQQNAPSQRSSNRANSNRARSANRSERPDHSARPGLRRADLHASVSDPLMDTMNFLNEITQRFPAAISFAPGRPYEGFVEIDQIIGYLYRYLDHLADEGRTAQQIRSALYQYGPTAGQIRELIAGSLHAEEGIDVPPESIVVTVGAQEAMFLALRALFRDRDDVLMVSSPCYVGISGAARILDIGLTAVDEHENGLRGADLVTALEKELAAGRRPRAVYVVPDHSNPSGVTMDLRARQSLLEIAGRYDLLILEDSPYRLVSPGPRRPSLKSLDRDRRVVLVGSFSKTVFPGARAGYVVADQVVMDDEGPGNLLADELAKIKSMVTLNTPSLSQAVVAGALLSSGGHVARLNEAPAEHYRDSLVRALEQLDRLLPPARREQLGVSWNVPDGGFFLTLTVPFPADEAALTRSAEEFGVLWTPMAYFHPQGGGEQAIRLATSYLSGEQVDAGITRLAAFVQAEATRAEAARVEPSSGHRSRR